MRKVEKEMASLTEEEIEVSTEFLRLISGYCETHLIPVKRMKIKVGSASAKSFWSAQPDGPDLFVVRTEVTEDNFAKWAFAKSAKLC